MFDHRGFNRIFSNGFPDEMSSQNVKNKIRVALAGNPNAGKTSIFNALTGQHQHIGNYPGVTVEKKVGSLVVGDLGIEVVDLPGTYSLSAYSIEELVARDFVLEEKPDIIVSVLDSTNLERNLYLLLQFQELGIPVIGVLNMMDEAEQQGIWIDSKQLGKILGIPFVETIGHRGEGIEELKTAIVEYVKKKSFKNSRRINYGRELEGERHKVSLELAKDEKFAERYNPDWLAIKLLEEDKDALEKIEKHHSDSDQVKEVVEISKKWINQHFNEESPVVVGEQRYAYIHGAVIETVTKRENINRINVTELVDRIVINKYAGLFIFFLVMFLIYQVTFAIGNPLSDLLDGGIAMFSGWLSGILPNGILEDLLIDGIIGGVGGVLVFFPLVLFLFMGLSFLEDSGYMARAAFVMDRIFHTFGMHGRSFVPFMIATGCAVPAVMSARTLVNPRDRIITILVTPIMMCGAKSPVIAMLAAAFFPSHAAFVFWLVWLAGWIIAFLAAYTFRKTLFKGESAPFVMELPPYRMPTVRSILHHMWERSWLYVKKAGTFILAASLIIWFLLYFPQTSIEKIQEQRKSAGEIELTDSQISTLQLENSYAGRIGKFIEPALKPAGFDYKIGVGLFAGFAAKEVIISTMGIVYGIGDADPDGEGDISERTPLKEKMANDPAYSPAMALAMMFFVLVYIPCMAVMAVVRKELGSMKWVFFMAGYTLAVAWTLAVIVYQLSALAGLA